MEKFGIVEKKMKKLLIFILLSMSIFAETIFGTVVSVHDGDTITLLKDSKEYKIRFNGIDAPELSQDYGKEVQEYLSDRILNQDVDIKILDTDKYGRYIGEVYWGDLSINREMVEMGLAWHYKQYSKDETLEKLENEARENSIGLWSESDPIAPWDYRHGTSTSSTTTKATGKAKVAKTDTKENVVYVTKTGKKYHRAGCSSLLKSKIEISKSDAIDGGYEACGKCKP